MYVEFEFEFESGAGVLKVYKILHSHRNDYEYDCSFGCGAVLIW
jgi:hypothetical protein